MEPLGQLILSERWESSPEEEIREKDEVKWR